MFKSGFLHARFTSLGLLLLLSGLLAACGGDNPTATPPPVPTPAPAASATTSSNGSKDNSAEIIVTLTEFSIAPKVINANAGHLKFKLVNAGQIPHNFGVMVNGTNKKSPNINSGDTAIFELDLTSGTYDTICDLPTHKDQGMFGTIVVK